MLLADFLLSPQMVTKISLLKISAAASLLECEHTAQDFIVAADAVFIKAQGLATLVPLHKMVFGLLEGLLDNWHLLNLDSMEWRCKAKGKGKAKATEEDKDEEGEATQKLRKELEDFVVPTKHVKLVWAAKAFLEWQGKLLQLFVLEGFKGKGKAKALLVDSEQTGTKQAFKSTELVDSNSNKKEEEKKVCVIKKIKHKHIEELIGTRKGKEIMELEDLEDEMVVPKTPAAGPLHQTKKPMVLISSMPKSVPKPIIALASPVAGPSTAQIVPGSALKPTAAAHVSKPVPVKSAVKPAVKGGSVFKDPFIVRQFKLVGTEESSALIINQATEVAAGKVTSIATQETLQSEDTGDKNDNDKDSNDNEDDDKGGKDDDDDSDNDNDAAMDSSNLDVKISKVLHSEETQSMAPTKVTVTDVVALAPVPPTKLNKTPFFKLSCISKHVPFLPTGLQTDPNSISAKLSEC
ncbi:hypothetical protein C0995_001403 [Termitomyces sp. Mi166|nr:hypothetical protein C0995_001403 [Termitomyces sp. Mi166\